MPKVTRIWEGRDQVTKSLQQGFNQQAEASLNDEVMQCFFQETKGKDVVTY